MNGYRSGKTKYTLGIVLTIVLGIVINCILGFVPYKFGLPLYLDTVGTIGVTLTAGAFPGIVTGVVTNVVSGFFNADALYYSIISALIAVATVWFCRRYQTNRWRRSFVLITALALISGILGTLFQFIITGGPQFDLVSIQMSGYMQR